MTLVSQGFLQHDIDYILYWVIALEKFSSEKYEEALPLFVRVKEKFADKFAGILSFKMNEQGFSFRANLPAIQLFYNLAYTLSMNDKYDESIKYWSELLTGGSTKGGSMMVYDTLMVAISIKNHDAVKLCAFALFNRALAYQQIGMFEEAKNDYEKLVTVSSQSEILKSYIQPIEDFINQQLKMNTDETNK